MRSEQRLIKGYSDFHFVVPRSNFYNNLFVFLRISIMPQSKRVQYNEIESDASLSLRAEWVNR